MIYVTGDTHGDMRRFSAEWLPESVSWSAGDKLIVTGDFGFVFQGESALSEKNNLNALARKPYEILFADGNHEGFDALAQYPVVTRYGAPVTQIRENVFHLHRGYIYTIEDKTFFVMGGAASIDKAYRLSYESISGQRIWFPQELPTAEEYRRAIDNLQSCGNRVDYIITHTAPTSIVYRMLGRRPDGDDAELTGFLDWVYHEVTFRHWYFGHFHEDRSLNDQVTACNTICHPIP